ncbi:HNH endonuclease [Priestia koreensis]|uniref:HNH endonuclease n=1 Tax=Priestia koreensis TaxID=284581 RepID=UPI001F566B34|nr:HNH endonuclease [Priestia koreensis]UNL87565.1 hypothetical protein IE339_23980 [Priestia koreensis]
MGEWAIYDLFKTFSDPCSTNCDKGLALAGLIPGIGPATKAEKSFEFGTDVIKKSDHFLKMDFQFFASKDMDVGRKWSSDKGIYSAAYEANLPKDMYPNVSSPRHFQNTNEQLYNTFESVSRFKQQMEELYPRINKGVQPGKRGKFSRNSPTNEGTWNHHSNREGVTQLVPWSQHQAKGPIQQMLHPCVRGGMENWAGGR